MRAFTKNLLWIKTIGLILLLMLNLPANSSYGRSLLAQKQDLWTGAGPSIKFEPISIEHGLSQSSVRCIFQDRKGFMWFGTADGLNKYDGYNFTIYKPEFDNPNSLSHNVINAIYEDHSGRLWVGTNGGGLNKFDREKETFTHYKHDPKNPNSIA